MAATLVIGAVAVFLAYRWFKTLSPLARLGVAATTAFVGWRLLVNAWPDLGGVGVALRAPLLALVVGVAGWVWLRGGRLAGGHESRTAVATRPTSGKPAGMSGSRWRISVHETGHCLAAKDIGATGAYARYGGFFEDVNGFSSFDNWYGTPARDRAFFLLAGPAAAQVIAGTSPNFDGFSWDYEAARELCREAGISYSRLDADAHSWARRNRARIVAGAVEMDRKGRLS